MRQVRYRDMRHASYRDMLAQRDSYRDMLAQRDKPRSYTHIHTHMHAHKSMYIDTFHGAQCSTPCH